MEIPEKEVQEFKEIWKNEYGQDLTDAEAVDYKTRLVEFFELLIKIDRRQKKPSGLPKGN